MLVPSLLHFLSINFRLRSLCAVASPSLRRLEWFVFALINQTYVMLRITIQNLVYTQTFFLSPFDYSPLPKIKHGEKERKDEKIVMMISVAESSEWWMRIYFLSQFWIKAKLIVLRKLELAKLYVIRLYRRKYFSWRQNNGNWLDCRFLRNKNDSILETISLNFVIKSEVHVKYFKANDALRW